MTFESGEMFLLGQARLLERRLFAAAFRGGPRSGAVAALLGYQNEDGGFGQALEPDVRAPISLPIFVETAFDALVSLGGRPGDPAEGSMLLAACDYLGRVAAGAGAGGAVPPAAPAIEHWPRAVHWSEWTYAPGLNPTAGLVGRLHQLGVDHPWRDQAESWCWDRLDAGEVPLDAHTVKEVLVFLDHVPDRTRADTHAAALAERFEEVAMLQLDPDAEGYGVTPLQLAPTPESRWRRLFDDKQIEGHLDRVAAAQEADGGWPITWEPPSPAAVCEWRGVVTLDALRILVANGRMRPPDS